jgi:F-type H+-transporting ATPase subunit delta
MSGAVSGPVGSAVSVSAVTARYADALFELAREKGLEARVEADVAFLAREVAEQSVAADLFDARVPPQRRRQRVEALGRHLQPLTRNFLGLLEQKRRLEVLRELPEAFHRCLLRARGAVEGVVEAPRPLEASEVAGLARALGRALAKDVELEARVRPELIAGARVIVDNKLLDGSALGRLESLRERLRAAPIAHTHPNG